MNKYYCPTCQEWFEREDSVADYDDQTGFTTIECPDCGEEMDEDEDTDELGAALLDIARSFSEAS